MLMLLLLLLPIHQATLKKRSWATPDEVGARHLPGLGIIHKNDDLHILSASTSNLAQLFQDQGRLATAEPLMQEDLRDNREELTTRTVHRAL